MRNTNQTGPKLRVRREALRQLTVADLTLAGASGACIGGSGSRPSWAA